MGATKQQKTVRLVDNALELLITHFSENYEVNNFYGASIYRPFGGLQVTNENTTFNIYLIDSHILPLAIQRKIHSEEKNHSIILPIKKNKFFPEEKTILGECKGDYPTVYRALGDYKEHFNNMLIVNDLRKLASIHYNDKLCSQHLDLKNNTLHNNYFTHIPFLKDKEATIISEETFNLNHNLAIDPVHFEFLKQRTGVLYITNPPKKEEKKKEVIIQQELPLFPFLDF